MSAAVGRATLHASAIYTLAGHGSKDTTLGDRAQYGLALSWRIGNGADSHPHAADRGHHAAHGSHAHEAHAHSA